MELDNEYYNKIVEFIQKKDNTKYFVDDLTDNHLKFIFHVEHYIENKSEGLIVEFSSDKKTLTVLELFESVFLKYEQGSIIQMNELERQEHVLKVSAQFISEEKKQKIMHNKKINNGLFQ